MPSPLLAALADGLLIRDQGASLLSMCLQDIAALATWWQFFMTMHPDITFES
ncbi:MAG: hypothetical protein ISS63_00820 [Desulfobacteraceae bacterium]|nr:hypothetical protein [Desulfobacteraceae bacterium]